MKQIQLSKFGKNRGKYVVLVDDEDYEYLNQWNWCADKNKSTIYAKRLENETSLRMHCLIMKNKGIDHIDHNGLNNQKSNLRLCTQQENMMNMSANKNTSSKYKGVFWYKRDNNWRSCIKVNNSNKHLGYFTNEIEAANAYDNAAKKYYKEFAYLNFKHENN